MRTPAAPARGWLAADLAVKAVVVALIVLALAFPTWERFADKAMTGRAVAYPLALLVVPVGWLLTRRRSRYPAVADLLFSLPWAVDLVGNALDLFDAVDWFDDVAHVVNWALLSAALAVLLPRSLPAWVRVLLCLGLGSTAALFWELSEYYTFIRGGTELATAYTDTLGDMAGGTLGALLAGLVVTVLRAHRGPDDTARPGVR